MPGLKSWVNLHWSMKPVLLEVFNTQSPRCFLTREAVLLGASMPGPGFSQGSNIGRSYAAAHEAYKETVINTGSQ